MHSCGSYYGPLGSSQRGNKMSRVYGSVTNNNGLWIGWFDLLHLLVQSRLITINFQPSPSSLTAEDSVHSHSRSTTDF
jgi:hypothetical protein